MTERKTLQKLTLKDNFLFAAVMSEPENCKQLLELTLGIAVDHVEVDTDLLLSGASSVLSGKLNLTEKWGKGICCLRKC